MWRVGGAIGALLVSLTGCASVVPLFTPHDANAVFRSGSMVADRDTAIPGDVVQLTFPDEMTRGIHFVLEEEVGDTWVYRYGLISNADLGGPPSWFVPGEDENVCTGNAVQNVCVRLQIVEP